MEIQEKIDFLNRFCIDERAIQKRLLIGLFNKMKFEKIDYTHGPQEKGKDFVLEEINKAGYRDYIGVVVKKGDLSKKEMNEACNQAVETFYTMYGDIYINKIWILFTGKMKGQAKECSKAFLNTVYRHTSFIDGNNVVKWVDKYYSEFFS